MGSTKVLPGLWPYCLTQPLPPKIRQLEAVTVGERLEGQHFRIWNTATVDAVLSLIQAILRCLAFYRLSMIKLLPRGQGFDQQRGGSQVKPPGVSAGLHHLYGLRRSIQHDPGTSRRGFCDANKAASTSLCSNHVAACGRSGKTFAPVFGGTRGEQHHG